MPDRELLPPEHQIEHLAALSYEELVTGLLDLYDRKGHFVTMPYSPEQDRKVHDDIRYLYRLLSGPERDICVEVAVYQGYHFAYTASSMIQPGPHPPRVYTDDYTTYGELYGSKPLRDKIYADTLHYLNHKPVIARLINACLDAISPTDQLKEITRTATALIFLQIEIGNEVTYIDDQIAELARQFPEQ
jgi:hypothetical protein